MKNLKSKILGGVAGLGMALTPMSAQTPSNTDEKNNSEWESFIGTCAMLPNDSDFRDIFESYFGIQGEAHKKINNDIYVGVNGVFGFGKASNENYTLKARQTELMPSLVYKIDKFEIGAGPVLANLKLIEEYEGQRDNQSISGLGLGGKAKYTIMEGKKLDIAIFGAYSSVKPSDDDFDIELGTTKFGLFFLLK